MDVELSRKPKRYGFRKQELDQKTMRYSTRSYKNLEDLHRNRPWESIKNSGRLKKEDR